MQIQIQNLLLKQDLDGGERCVVVQGSSPHGPVDVVVSDGPTENLVKQILASAGPDVLRARLSALSRPWVCLGEARALDGVQRLEVRDAASIRLLCEHVRSAIFVSERGEPILVGFPPYQGEGFGQ